MWVGYRVGCQGGAGPNTSVSGWSVRSRLLACSGVGGGCCLVSARARARFNRSLRLASSKSIQLCETLACSTQHHLFRFRVHQHSSQHTHTLSRACASRPHPFPRPYHHHPRQLDRRINHSTARDHVRLHRRMYVPSPSLSPSPIDRSHSLRRPTALHCTARGESRFRQAPSPSRRRPAAGAMCFHRPLPLSSHAGPCARPTHTAGMELEPFLRLTASSLGRRRAAAKRPPLSCKHVR